MISMPSDVPRDRSKTNTVAVIQTVSDDWKSQNFSHFSSLQTLQALQTNPFFSQFKLPSKKTNNSNCLTNENANIPDLTIQKGTNESVNLQAVPSSSKKVLTFAQAHELLNKTRQRYEKSREVRIMADLAELNKMLED